MRRLMTFFLGMVAGALLLFGAMNYHLVRAYDGVHFVPKVSPKLAAAYVDIRGFTVADWAQHPEIATALMKANQGDLMKNAASETLQAEMDRLLNRENSR